VSLAHKINEDPAKLQLFKREQQLILARELIGAFCSYVFKWKQQKIHNKWHEFADSHPRALIFAPQEHGKTSQMSLARPLFKLGQDPNRLLKIVSCNDDKAIDILGVIAKTIEFNPRLHEVFPDLQPAERGTWTKHQITVKRDLTSAIDASVEALGVLSTAGGDRATDLMFDDPVDFRNSILQPSLRKMVKRSYTATWLGLLVKGGRVTYICNAWHHDDLSPKLWL